MLATALADDHTDGQAARARLAAEGTLHAPELIDLEVLWVFRKRALAGRLDARRAGWAIRDLESLPLVRYPHLPLLRRAWALRSNVTPYDAAYLALAEALDVVFVTADRALARVRGVGCAVEVLGA